MRGNKTDQKMQFAGLTRHDAQQITERAADVSGIDAEHPPERSFATAIRELKTASSSSVAWRVPSSVAKRLNEGSLAQFNTEMPEGIQAYQAERPGDGEPTVFIETDRFQSFYSPEVLKQWMMGNLHDVKVELDSGEIANFPQTDVPDDAEVLDISPKDALWHVPTQDASVTNAVPLYEPLEEAIRDEELGGSMFGEIRTTKMGGEVHMDILFDAFTIDLGDDVDMDEVAPAGGPIVLGIRTGYDFFGGVKMYAEGFAQDTACNNSIRAVTEKKTRRAVGNVYDDVKDWWESILTEMDLMTDQLTEMIEIANGINVDVLDLQLAQPLDHNDDLRAFYDLLGFPDYLSQAAASNVESRAEDPFNPTMWDLNSGATYALTHEYRGGENTSRMRDLSSTANDMIMNPYLTAEQVERSHYEALAQPDGETEQGTLALESVESEVHRFTQSLEEQRDEFETRSEQLRETFITDEVQA